MIVQGIKISKQTLKIYMVKINNQGKTNQKVKLNLIHNHKFNKDLPYIFILIKLIKHQK